MRIAITREVSPTIARCELTHLPRRPIDFARACVQHRTYEQALGDLGCVVQTLPAEPDQPDSVFVEDAAVVFDEFALITRPGAPARREETASLAVALALYRSLVHLEAPATMDGGDVLQVERRVYVGLSGRTDRAAAVQLETAVRPHGYTLHTVAVRGCLHLKSTVTVVTSDTLLINPRWVEPERFPGLRLLPVAQEEPYAANGLLVGERLLYPTTFPATARRLEEAGVRLVPVDVTELQKAEGAVTCCSVVFEAEGR